ncbi:MAG: glycosyltransferase family 4 protein [Candidatus Saccharimonadales bacterium]
MATKSKSSKQLKIGYILDTSLDPTDGVQQYVVGIGEWMRSQGHEVHYLVGQTEKRKLPNIHSLSRNISVVFNGNRTTIPLPTSQLKLRKFMKRNHFDVLHVQTPHHPLMAQRLILSASKNTAVIGTFHILPYGKMPKLANKALGKWLRPSLKRIDKMLAVSKAAAEFEQWSFGLPAEVLPNVVDYSLFHSAKPLKQYSDNVVTILFLGRLVPRKGCMLLLEAISKLNQEKLPQFRVVICGKGPLEAALNNYAKEKAIRNVVEFTGFVSEEDKPSYYASADISVFPSSGGESFGIVLLEAMASGKAAVLAGDNPGYHSVMEAQTDTLFDPYNADELANKIERLIVDDRYRHELAKWSAEYAKDFDINVVGAKLESIYQEALRKRRQL